MYTVMNVNAPAFVPSAGSPAPDTQKLDNGLQGDQRKHPENSHHRNPQNRRNNHQHRQSSASAQKHHGHTRNDGAAYHHSKKREQKQKSITSTILESKDVEVYAKKLETLHTCNVYLHEFTRRPSNLAKKGVSL